MGAPPGVFVAGAFGFPGAGWPGLLFLAPGLFALPCCGPGLGCLLGFGFGAGGGLFGVVGVFGVVVVGVGGVGFLVVVVGVVVVGVLLGEGQDSLTFCTGPGRLSEETGAPGGS